MGNHRVNLLVLVAAMLVGACATSTTVGPTPVASGITRDEAIAIARATALPGRQMEVLSADARPFADVFPPSAVRQMKSPPPPDRLVWVVRLGEQPSPTGGQGNEVVIDSLDGHVIMVSQWAS